MLILTRRNGEWIKIGNDIFIQVKFSGQTQIKVGIDAPKEVSIVRTELLEREKRRNDNE